jgi:nitrite reductase/ring-hydroxylating ferredoxin subunit
LTTEEQIVTPAFGLIRSLLSRGPASGDDREHTDIEAAVDVCSADELDRSGRLVVRLSDPPIDVLVIRTRRRVFAVENRCPHLGVSLEGGNVRGRTITCTTHGRRFDLASGRCATGPGRPSRPLVTLRTWLDDGRVWLAAPGNGASCGIAPDGH